MTVRINMRMTLMKWWTLNRPPSASMYNRSPGGGRNNPFGREENWYIIARRAGKLPNSWRWTPLKEIWQKNFRFLLQVGAGGWVGSAWERDQADNRSHFHFNSPPKCPQQIWAPGKGGENINSWPWLRISSEARGQQGNVRWVRAWPRVVSLGGAAAFQTKVWQRRRIGEKQHMLRRRGREGEWGKAKQHMLPVLSSLLLEAKLCVDQAPNAESSYPPSSPKSSLKSLLVLRKHANHRNTRLWEMFVRKSHNCQFVKIYLVTTVSI